MSERIDCHALYTSAELERIFGRTLWRALNPHIRRLCRGMIWGEDVITAVDLLRSQQKAVDNSTLISGEFSRKARDETPRERKEKGSATVQETPQMRVRLCS